LRVPTEGVQDVPTYQYVCTECATPLEAVQKFTDDALTVCPACGGKLRKVFSSVGVVFKGAGFYRTDSRNDSKARVDAGGSASTSSESGAGGSAAATPAGSSSTESAGSTSGSDTKGAAKPDAGSNGAKPAGGKSDGAASSGTKPATSGSGSKTAATS
jgi:putative FmdB family regulatory protein